MVWDFGLFGGTPRQELMRFMGLFIRSGLILDIIFLATQSLMNQRLLMDVDGTTISGLYIYLVSLKLLSTRHRKRVPTRYMCNTGQVGSIRMGKKPAWLSHWFGTRSTWNKENDVCQFIRHSLCHLLRKHPKTEPFILFMALFKTFVDKIDVYSYE
jgi:hypothetical protein